MGLTEELFNKNITKINKTINFAVKNKFSDFYSKKYGKTDFLEINSYKEFKKLPLLKKDELLNVPLKDRTFISSDKITHYSLSSGTTTSNKPLVVANERVFLDELIPNDRAINEEMITKLGVKNFIAMMPIYSPLNVLIVNQRWKKVTPVIGDINNFPLTAVLMKEVGFEGIISSPTLLLAFSNILTASGYDTKMIKWILLMGELCTDQKLEEIKKTFPNASVEFMYSMSEDAVSLRETGYQCEHLSSESGKIYHIASNIHFIEILDEDGNEVPEGELGEIVKTDLFTPRGFPFIRYKTGDLGSIYKSTCNCGNPYFLKLGGRSNFDSLRVQGTSIHSQEIEDSLKTVRKFLEPGFQLHVYEDKIADKLMPRLELHLVLKRELETRAGLKELIKEKVENNLKLSQTRTLKDLIEMGVFQPLELKFLDKWPEGQFKSKNIISHLE